MVTLALLGFPCIIGIVSSGKYIHRLDVLYTSCVSEKVEKPMIVSPTPTQPQPEPEREVKPEEKKVKSTPIRRRTGETPVALFVKASLRPIFKSLYYLLQGIKTHKLVTLAVIVLLLASIIATN